MNFVDARRFAGQLVLFETDAMAIDYVPRSGTATVISVTPMEAVLNVRGEGMLRLPLRRILKFLTLNETDESN